MGFFAVTSREAQDDFDVKACHLSFWVLPKSFGRYAYCFDVGLRLHTKNAVRRFGVVLPFDAEQHALIDLSEMVLDADTSALIFGRPVVVQAGRIRYSGAGITGAPEEVNDRVVTVSLDGSGPLAERKEVKNFSIWTIELTETIPAKESIYVRFRFPVRSPHRIWTHKGWGFAKRGFVADLRVADARESGVLHAATAEVPSIKPIGSLFAFLVAPSYFVPQHVSPALHYSRLLEPRVWGKYLSNVEHTTTSTPSSYRGTAKFSIHQWRSPLGKAITVESPFRGYCDLAREFGFEVFLYYFAGVSLAPVVTWIVKEVVTWLANVFGLETIVTHIFGK